MGRNTAILVACTTFCCLAAGSAEASCVEDLTRIQLAMAKAAHDLRSRLGKVAGRPGERAKARGGVGGEGVALRALAAQNLPVLPPVQLSTPMADPQPQ